ncbi:MAG: FAD-dependent oxidoreductase [Chloroflexota bacterium]
MTTQAGMSSDLVVVGAGVAGLTAALTAADRGARVVVLSKGGFDVSASYLAQGGVAAVQDPDDSAELHVRDTLEAGRGMCRRAAVEAVVQESPDRVAELRAMGVPFDDDLALEGGHSRRRIAHVAGAETGQAITATLLERAHRHPAITLRDRTHVRALVPGTGVVTDTDVVSAPRTILATGGYAALWARTTNPAGSVGEGLVQAWAIGAALADLEFVQFHPTVLARSSLLLSEALRGEGAHLLDGAGERFVDELAPRDVVARAVGARDTAVLDLRPVPQERFRALMGRIEAEGYHPATDPVPISPAAHFTVGGIRTDLHGRTDVAGLYAAGECACTGLHGANRLASNSLAECLVFGRRAALAALGDPTPVAADAAAALAATLAAAGAPLGDDDREAMWRDVGLTRDAQGLARQVGSPVALARLVATSALAREESRGGHFRADFPELDHGLDGRHAVIRRTGVPTLEAWA